MTLDYAPSSTGQPLVWIWFNGRTPALFVLDTGTNYCVISDAFAAKIGLMPQPSPATLGGKQARQVTVPMLQVGSIRYPDTQMIVVDGGTLSTLSGNQVDGLIGCNLLATGPVFMDFQKHQATLFYDTTLTADQLHSLDLSGALPIPLTDHNGDLKFKAVVQLANGSKKASADLTVDTGGTDTIIPEETAHALGLKLNGPTHNYGGFVSDANVSDVSLSSISFGPPGIQVEDVTVKCARGNVPDGFPLRVGLDVLSHFQVLLDFGARKAYFKPSMPQIKIRVGAPLDKKP